jgi:CDP-diacylglycerol---serine O-phosphatidyltransferase
MRERFIAYRRMRSGRPRTRFSRVAVPSFFTLMSLFSGFVAITQIAVGAYVEACWLIVLAGFFDALDGMMARLANATSLFGVELDSLADVVSFGVAPSFLIYHFSLAQFGVLGLVVASLPAVCGAVRLARFNVNFDGDKKDYFMGLPIPMQAAGIVAIILNFQNATVPAWADPTDVPVLMPAVILLSFLMVSNIKFEAMPRPSARYIRANPVKSLMVLLAALSMLIFQQLGLLITMIGYLGHAIVRAIMDVVRDVMNAPLDGENGEEYPQGDPADPAT